MGVINSDTDGDGLNDWTEVITYGTSPANPDTDGDGLNDPAEIITYGDERNKSRHGRGRNARRMGG